MLRRLLVQAANQTSRDFGFHRPSSSFLFTRSFSSSSPAPAPGNVITSSIEHLEDGETSSTEPTSIPFSTLSIDRSSLHNPHEHSHGHSDDSDLVKHLKSIIKFRGGPISMAEYMEEVLTNPKHGFYINRDVFGKEGDFITSPEVSQMFGEMIGVWTMCLWEQMGRPNRVNLIELGPGRGTLMVDLIRGTTKCKAFIESLHIHMVECSPTLQKLQFDNLKCQEEANSAEDASKRITCTLSGSPISWHTTLEQVPAGVPTIIIAHEFYDALPVHQFQRAARGWNEKMVDVAEDSSLQFVLSRQHTPATLFLMKRFNWTTPEEIAKLNQIEICPKAMELTQTIAERIGSDGGGALIIDYGLNGVISDSLQAIRKHKFVNILDDPGSADLSAYVDFASIRHAAEEVSEDVSVHGPMTQSQFLGSLGINFRVESLMENCTDEQVESLRTGYWRLVGEGEAPFWEGEDDQTPIGMGTRYLAMAIVNKKQGNPVPFQ
ncbi:protein arginine methyltransferase NDUFAF7, mitochondrial [Impatiens glandulifera]|uniref:protein arginine methyltransferase NDUFAF7, mitochondrial n=1 Tax=Impatiens glandulifera TaxID=253017 RepID=UPI001FB16DC2|nr:protein arginine methyltransferase NDUFAF7, mitochondrial [Impatiens glandulifera]